MKFPNDGNLYGGLASPDLELDRFDLGSGIQIGKTYARVMTTFLVSGTKPSDVNPIGVPVRAVRGGGELLVTGSIFVPDSFLPPKPFDRINTLWTIAALLRLASQSHALILPVLADRSFDETELETAETMTLWSFETRPTQLNLTDVRHNHRIEIHDLQWVEQNWMKTIELLISSQEFNVAFQSFDRVRWAFSQTLGLLQTWTALEAFFSVGHGELRFRNSAFISAFLTPRGSSRLSEQKRIAKLYDARSAAAHGKDDIAEIPLIESYSLLRAVLIKVIEEGKVPRRSDLESLLFQ